MVVRKNVPEIVSETIAGTVSGVKTTQVIEKIAYVTFMLTVMAQKSCGSEEKYCCSGLFWNIGASGIVRFG